MIYWAETSEPIQDIPEREVAQRGLGCTLVDIEEHIRRIASGVNGEEVPIHCNRGLPGSMVMSAQSTTPDRRPPS